MNQGIWRSSDKGLTWQGPVWIWPRLEDILVLSNGSILGAIPGGFLVSIDADVNWDTIRVIDPEIPMNTLIELPGGGAVIAGSSAGIYRSSDNGGSWDSSGTGMPGGPGWYSFGRDRAIVTTWRAVYHSEDLAAWTRLSREGGVLVETNGDYLLAADSLYRSTDEGNTWQSIRSNPVWNYRLSTNSIGTLFAADHNGMLQRSTDRGLTWVRSGGGVSHGGAGDLKFRGPNGVHARGGLGLGSTTNNGDSWYRTHRTHDYSSYAAAIGPDLISWALASWHDRTGELNGLLRLEHGDTVWKHSTGARLPGAGDSAMALQITDDGAFFAIWDQRVFRSRDSGMSWRDVSAGLPDDARDLTIAFGDELEHRPASGRCSNTCFILALESSRDLCRSDRCARSPGRSADRVVHDGGGQARIEYRCWRLRAGDVPAGSDFGRDEGGRPGGDWAVMRGSAGGVYNSANPQNLPPAPS